MTKGKSEMAEMKLKPLGDRVLVEPVEESERTQSGLFIPATAKEKPQRGMVLAVGPGAYSEKAGKRLPPDVEVGNQVLFAKYAGTDFKLGGKEVKIMRESDILAIVEE
jgi:chaperonin GroES